MSEITISKTTWEYISESIADKVAKKISDNEEKYKWHDLRKNPDDLPKNGYYDTASYWHERYQNVRAFYDADKGKWMYHPDNNTGKDWVEGLNTIAWREIEPFIEEEAR